MKLLNAASPNGARVAVFLAEKGIALPIETVDLFAGEAQTDAFLDRNSLGQVPVLDLDDGRHLTESLAICRYLEELHPDRPLFGRDPLERAFTEMWTRRMELLFNAVGDVGLHEFEMFRERVAQNAAFAAARLRWLDREIPDDRPFVAGDAFSVADIVGMAMLMLADFAGIGIPPELSHVWRWEAALRARPSFPATRPARRTTDNHLKPQQERKLK